MLCWLEPVPQWGPGGLPWTPWVPAPTAGRTGTSIFTRNGGAGAPAAAVGFLSPPFGCFLFLPLPWFWLGALAGLCALMPWGRPRLLRPQAHWPPVCLIRRLTCCLPFFLSPPDIQVGV